MNIIKGQQALPFEVVDYQNNVVNLKDYKGKKVLLTFFRGASCPFCNLRLNQLINRYPEFEAQNICIVTFFGSSREEISKYAGKQNPPFPIIPDPYLKWYKHYGIEQSQWGALKAMLKPKQMWEVMTSKFFGLQAVVDKPIIPADFLIDENGIIVFAHYGNDFGDHIAIEQVLEWDFD